MYGWISLLSSLTIVLTTSGLIPEFPLRSVLARSVLAGLLEHRHPQPLLPSDLLSSRIARVSMSNNSDPRIRCQYPFKPLSAFRRSISHKTHSRMYAVAHPDSATLMNTHPRCTGGSIEKRVKDRPVGYRVASIHHPFRLPSRGSYTPAIEVISSDPYGTR